MKVLIDGVPVAPEHAVLPVFDIGLQRGFGCFEVVRAYGGVPFRMAGHLDRLYAGMGRLGIQAPARRDLESWVTGQAGAGGDGLVRIIVTGGSVDARYPGGPRCIVIWEPNHAVPLGLRLMPQTASWLGPPAAGAAKTKTLSYADHVHATRSAQAAGSDNALLFDRSGRVLEGPTFAVAWMRSGVLETPSLELGILGSITRSAVLDLAAESGITVMEGAFGIEAVAGAAEMMAMSTVVEVVPVVAVGDHRFDAGPATRQIADAFHALVTEETGG